MIDSGVVIYSSIISPHNINKGVFLGQIILVSECPIQDLK